MILLDTSVIISYLKEIDISDAFLKSVLANDMAMSVMTIAEMELGFLLNPSRKKEVQKYHFGNFLTANHVQIISITPEISKMYAQIQSQLMKHGEELSRFDGLIAATALEKDLELYTKDADFKRVKGLKCKLI